MSLKAYQMLASLIDTLIERVGKLLSFLMIVLVCVVLVVVVGRYFFQIGSIALQELITYLHATIFLLGISYTLKHDGHVRVDIFYRDFSQKKKALVNLIGGVFFVLPISVFILWFCMDYVVASWNILETSKENNGLPFVYLLKSLILVMPILLILQALTIMLKNLLVLSKREATILNSDIK